MQSSFCVIDGNEAAANVAYRSNEVCVIYPITPASSMGELSDQWSAEGVPNIWHAVPDVVEMQSEAGACGAIHGVLQTGGLATTFTASQGLLLMIPDMYRIAAELTPTVFHVSARTVAYQGMSIYCDHSDAMATRTTGFGLLCSSNVQMVHDMALISQAVALQTGVPFVHFFDGFRTSHEVSKIHSLTDEHIRAMIEEEWVVAHRNRRMCSEQPSTRGVIYNSDIYFQTREAMSPYYDEVPAVFENTLAKFQHLTGRSYHIVEYYGHPEAERVIVLMGSMAETVRETVDYLAAQGEKVGVLQVNLFQPFPTAYFLKSIPKTCRSMAVLDRTKECGAGGEPLYQKVATSIMEGFSSGALQTETLPKVVGGRVGLMGKEFNPAMVKGLFEELTHEQPKNNFTMGINDDLSHTHLPYDETFEIEPDDVVRAIFYGLGADGTVSANKNTMKIIGEATDHYVQGYFIYDAKKSGSRTISHLRFGPRPIRSTYLITSANFVGCHQFGFVNRLDVLEHAAVGATFLLNSPYGSEEVWHCLSAPVQQQIVDKQLKFYVIDAYRVAKAANLGARINTIMQTCFFKLTNILSTEAATINIKNAIKKAYATKGDDVVQQNFAAVDCALENLHAVLVPTGATTGRPRSPIVSDEAPEFVREVEAVMLLEKGDQLPVSAIPADGYFPNNTCRWEKRNVSMTSPVWNADTCVQCGRCAVVCPHSCIRAKMVTTAALQQAPDIFQTAALKGKVASDDKRYALQIYHEDCTGCDLCVRACPVKPAALTMTEKADRMETDRANVNFFESLPYADQSSAVAKTVKDVQYLQPFFEFSSACSGCGETPYVKLVSQLFGNRMIIGDPCGCSSVYGGSLPTSPWAQDKLGCGPAWSSSLFEDNAEFVYGFCLTEDYHREYAKQLLRQVGGQLDAVLVDGILNAVQTTEAAIQAQRDRVMQLKVVLADMLDATAKSLLSVADFLIKHSLWGIGGDGWAYDIGFGGLDHVLASNRNINLLVLDTEVYSNTGGQASKATPRGSVAKFTYQGKATAKKDLGLMMMTYGSVFVCSIALGADAAHAIKALKEAEAYDGPSLILAYSHCIAHGIDIRQGMEHQKLAVQSGYWPLYRFDPNRAKEGLNPFQLDSKSPSVPFENFAQLENRYRILSKTNPDHMKDLMKQAQDDIDQRWQKYETLASQ